PSVPSGQLGLANRPFCIGLPIAGMPVSPCRPDPSSQKYEPLVTPRSRICSSWVLSAGATAAARPVGALSEAEAVPASVVAASRAPMRVPKVCAVRLLRRAVRVIAESAVGYEVSAGHDRNVGVGARYVAAGGG